VIDKGGAEKVKEQATLAAAIFTSVGLIHAYELTPGGVATRFGLLAAPEFTVGYLLLFVLSLAAGWWEKGSGC